MGKTSEAPSTVELDNQANITAVSENTLVAALPAIKQNNFLKQLHRRKIKPSSNCLTMKSLSLDLHDQPCNKKYLKRVASMSTMRSIPEHGSLYPAYQEDNMPALRTPVSIDNGYRPAHQDITNDGDISPHTDQTNNDIVTWAARSDDVNSIKFWSEKSSDICARADATSTSDIDTWTKSTSDNNDWTYSPSDIDSEAGNKTWTGSTSDFDTWTERNIDTLTNSTSDIKTWTNSQTNINTWRNSTGDKSTGTDTSNVIRTWTDSLDDIKTWTDTRSDNKTHTDRITNINFRADSNTWTCSDTWTESISEWIFTIMLNLSVWILCLYFVIWNIFYIPCFVSSNDYHMSYNHEE